MRNTRIAKVAEELKEFRNEVSTLTYDSDERYFVKSFNHHKGDLLDTIDNCIDLLTFSSLADDNKLEFFSYNNFEIDENQFAPEVVPEYDTIYDRYEKSIHAMNAISFAAYYLEGISS